jgi:hypothetical protein
MPFPSDPYWTEALAFLQEQAQPIDAILAPNDFLEFFPGTYHYRVASQFAPRSFTFVVFHKGMVAEVDQTIALTITEQFHLVYTNDVFVIYSQQPIANLPAPDDRQATALIEQIETRDRFDSLQSSQACAILVTTSNRPENLARSLPQLVRLGAPLLIVDDGSDPEPAAANQHLADQYQIELLRSPLELATG